MRPCASCGEENPERARFCLGCGVALTDAVPAGELRKVVSMVFCDLEGSTTLASSMDPEALSRVLARWVAAMRWEIEKHEGTYVEFRGDSILGVFGIPTLHEDDALRAVRAAVGMRDALDRLNLELAMDSHVTLSARFGVNTGEVLIGPTAGTGLVVGDAVNVAARLEQAAPAGEVLLGEETERLVRSVVRSEALAPLQVKGKIEPLAAYRVVEIGDGARTRPGCLLDAGLVGRADELARLDLLAKSVRDERICRGALVSGDAGVGKTRLVEEFLSGVGREARIGRGICRAYGESALTPAAEVVRSLLRLPDDADALTATARIEEILGPDADTVHMTRLLVLLGLTEENPPSEETFASTRRLIEAVARVQPVFVFIDDVHWAASPLVDLIEHLLAWTRDAPVLVMCTARAEFQEAHPRWLDDRTLGILDVTLRPLSEVETDLLALSLLGAGTLSRSVRERLSEASEGNPLFLEQLLAMLIDDGHLVADGVGGWMVADESAELPVPPSIHALLAARLDRLALGERRVIERGAVVGRVFSWTAVEALSESDDRAQVGGDLMTLVRRDLVRPDRSAPVGETAFGFHHVLIRDTVYGAMPKEVRAELHERYASWLEGRASSPGELEETLGYHLERACLLRRDLAIIDRHTEELGERAAEFLAIAGERAARRGQGVTAQDLFSRALALTPPAAPSTARLLRCLAEADYEVGEFASAGAHAHAALHTDGVEPADAMASRVLLAYLRFQLDPDGVLEATRDTARELLGEASARGDDRTLAMVHRLLARADLWAGDTVAMADNAERAFSLAERCGDAHERAEAAVLLCWALNLGPEPLSAVVDRLRSLADATSDNRRVQAVMWAHLASALALRGDTEDGREMQDRAIERFRDLGLEVQAAIATQASGGSLFPAVARAAACEARDGLRWACDVLHRAAERGFLASVTGMLAEAEFDAGNLDEAQTLVDACRTLASDDDVDAQQRWRLVGAKIAATQGRSKEARSLLSEVETRPATFPAWVGFVAADRAEVLALLGDRGDASTRLEEARTSFASKQITAAAPRLAAVEAIMNR